MGQVTAPTLTAVAVPEPETVPSRKPAATAVRPAALRDLRKAATDRSTKNRLAPERSSTAPVDGEQHDVRGGDVQRGAVEPAARVVERVDDLREVESGVGDRPVLREKSAVVPVREEGQTDDRERPPRRTPARLDDQHQQHGPEHDVGRLEQSLAVEEPVVATAERIDRIEADDQRGDGQHPVRQRGPVTLAVDQPGAVREEDQRERAGQKDDQVVLAAAGQGPEHLPQHEQRDREGDDRDAQPDAARQITGGQLLVVDVEDLRHWRSTAIHETDSTG